MNHKEFKNKENFKNSRKENNQNNVEFSSDNYNDGENYDSLNKK